MVGFQFSPILVARLRDHMFCQSDLYMYVVRHIITVIIVRLSYGA